MTDLADHDGDAEKRLRPETEADPRLIWLFSNLATVAAIAAATTGGVVLVGWFADLPLLTSVRTGWIGMKANAAVGFIVAGSTLALCVSRGRGAIALARLGAIFLVALGLATLFEYVSGNNLGIDELVIDESPAASGAFPEGRMAPESALHFVILGASLAFLADRRWSRLSAYLAFPVVLSAAIALFAYALGTGAFYSLGGKATHMSILTVLSLLALSLGIILTSAMNGGFSLLVSRYAGGVMVRRLLPWSLVTPITIVWLQLVGQSAGLIENDTVGAASAIAAITTFISGALVWAAASLDGIDHVRTSNARQLASLNVSLRDRVSELKAANTQLMEFGSLQQRSRDIAVIDDLNETLQSCNSREEAYPLIAIAAQQVFPQSTGALAMVSGNTHDLETVSSWGGEPSMLPHFALDDCWALRLGQSHELEAVGKGPLCTHFTHPPASAYLCMPLSVRGEGIGLLHIALTAPALFNDSLRGMIRTFGDMIKLSLANLKLREDLRDQSIRDPLTGLYNRRYLGEISSREIDRARRHKLPLTVVMLDIDHFKVVNDTYGHDAGDAVLRELGRFLHNSIRSSDLAFRYGGEEFVLILTDADLQATTGRIENISQQIRQLKIAYREQQLPVLTVSAGVALFPEHGASTEELIAAADHAMYAAKAAGRDRIQVFNGAPLPAAAVPPPVIRAASS